MRQPYLAQRVDGGVVSLPVAGGGAFAASVQAHDRRIAVRRREKRACRVRGVMPNEVPRQIAPPCAAPPAFEVMRHAIDELTGCVDDVREKSGSHASAP